MAEMNKYPDNEKAKGAKSLKSADMQNISALDGKTLENVSGGVQDNVEFGERFEKVSLISPSVFPENGDIFGQNNNEQ